MMPTSPGRTFLVAAGLLLGHDALMAQDAVDFVRDVRPILSQHCFACHGPDEESRKADLDLSRRESALEIAIAAGDPNASEMWRRITDTDDPMPPADAHNPLSAAQVDVLRRWIAAGASYAPHWAFVDPVAAEPPAGGQQWSGDPIDRFLWSTWREKGMEPTDDADGATLLRRLTYDLTGLPPTLAELDAFAEGGGDLEAAVDRLLASPHYGERMAMVWLDLVRFADTVGYHGDQGHRVWPYRDYVIHAFNDNLPFDRFTVEQLAGDLLPDPTQDQLVATTYNRLLQTSHEGGLQLGEYREIYLADRVRNVSSVWMGATVGCAQCHDHKFDPYTSRDFYSLGAFFADIDDEEHLRNPYGGLNGDPTKRVPEMRVFSDAAWTRIAELEAAIPAAENELKAAITSLPERRDAWMAARRAGMARRDPVEETWVDDKLETGGKQSGRWKFERRRGVKPHSGRAYRVQSNKGLVQHYTVETDKRQIVVESGQVFFAWVHFDAKAAPEALMLQFHVRGKGWEQRAVWGNDKIAYGRRKNSWLGYRRQGELPEAGKWVALEVDLERLGLKAGQVVNGVAFTQFGGTVRWDRSGVRTQFVPPALAAALSAEAPTKADRDLIDRFHRATDETVAGVKKKIDDLREQRKRIDTEQPLTMFTRALEEPREVKIRPRGNWLDNSGEVVQPAIPAFLGALETDGRASRMDLARWLVDREGHGLRTSRVFVNRVWAMFFGAGLCPSTEDFGGQGRPPVHPELLDHLAVWFVDSGWDVKGLVKRIVATRAYRMASTAPEAALKADPFNELFARQSRQRWPAEMVRDTALALSGLMVRQIGGESAKPPQPAGYYRHLNFPPRRYKAHVDQRQWRRGVYVHWQRQFLHPMLRAFDAPTREECVTTRSVSNTPTAALTLLNDPVFVEAARAFAQRTLAVKGDDEVRITHAFRRATARPPTAAELKALRAFLDGARGHFRKNSEAATQLLATGSAARDDSFEPVELAAWAEFSRVLLNLHEVITRG